MCRSTFGAELLSTEEAFDVGVYCRGLLAIMKGYPMSGRHTEAMMDAIPLIGITDCKDVYDKNTSDTPSYGSQKSLSFTIAWLRATLGRPNTSLRWTATENIWVDAGTKDMNLDHMQSGSHASHLGFRQMELRVQPRVCQADHQEEEACYYE